MAASSSGPPTKVARLDGGWKDRILAQGPFKNMLPDSAMPFVNRHSEVFELFEANFRAVDQLSTGEVTNFRGLEVCFAAQMFGSGKTTLGENFVKQLSDEGFNKYVDAQLDGKEEFYEEAFRAELELAKTARTLYVDLGGRRAVSNVPGILAEKVELAVPADADTAEGIAKVIFAQARRSTEPLFVHLDEIGGFGEDVRTLRDGVRCTWQKMNALREQDMPHIYFYLSGKGIPLTALGSTTSPVGTKWIILDILHREHIQTIREKLLPGSEARLDAGLEQWTGGAPRLLLYVLRALHHLGETSGSDLDELLTRVYNILDKIPIVRGDVFVGEQDEGFKEAWLHLMVLGQLRLKCRREMKLRVGAQELTIERLLAALNVYITKAKDEEDTFHVHIMKLVERFVRSEFGNDCRVPLFFGDVHTTGLDAAELLERLVEQRIIVHACLNSQGLTWQDLAKPLLDGSKVGSKSVNLDQTCPLVVMPGVNDSCGRVSFDVSESALLARPTIHSLDLGALFATVRSNRIYRPRAKSGSADTFVKQGDFLIEIQDKSGVAAGLSLADVNDEVKKCIGEGDVVLLFVALKLNDSLARWVGDGVLTLAPGTYQEKQGSRGGPLLYKSCGADAWEQEIASAVRSPAVAGAIGKHVQLSVRQGLEVVVPSPAAVRKFLGDADFEVVRKLASKKSKETVQVDIPFISRFFGFSVQPRAMLSPQGAVAIVWARELQLPGTLVGSAFKVKGTLADIDDLKKAIKAETPSRVQCDAHELDIYQHGADGKWVKEEEDGPVCATTKGAPYGFVLPAA